MSVAESISGAGRPKLWFFAPTFIAPSEVWLHRQAVGIRRLEVSVITQKRDCEDRTPLGDIPVHVVEGVRRQRLSWFARFQNQLANFPHVRFTGSRAELKWWIDRFERDRPDGLLCQYGLSALRLLPLARKLGLPLVAHFHGFDLSRALASGGYRARLRWALPQFSGVVVVADFQRRWMLEHGVAESRLRLIPCGVPTGEFACEDRNVDRSCKFLAVGRLVPKKAPEFTLRAFAECVRTNPNCELRIIGDGPLEQSSKELVRALGIENHVQFLGAQPNERVRQEMRTCDVFVQHSVTAPDGDKEGWPVSIAEACASALPVVSTRHAGIIDQIDEGVTGLLVDEGDWQQMAVHMTALARDANLRYRLGAAGRKHIEQFDSAIQIAKLEAFTLECVSKNKP